jgi:hypothetical protein
MGSKIIIHAGTGIQFSLLKKHGIINPLRMRRFTLLPRIVVPRPRPRQHMPFQRQHPQQRLKQMGVVRNLKNK